MKSISFHSHHSPMGAFTSFTCGKLNSNGGFAEESESPANNNIFIGYKDSDDEYAGSHHRYDVL